MLNTNTAAGLVAGGGGVRDMQTVRVRAIRGFMVRGVAVEAGKVTEVDALLAAQLIQDGKAEVVPAPKPKKESSDAVS